ncbi:hypothetical protein FACS1894172_01950 [Spirochaetia bacterium]|nr:hypothetical protein FACS1894172_01950 [Spirochaetia bacterium]
MQYKDTVFRQIFGQPKNALELYNIISGTNYSPDTPVQMKQVSDDLQTELENDIAFIIKIDNVNKLVILIEHQSTINPNMPLRFLAYVCHIYRTMIADNDLDLYGKKQIQLPQPEFIIAYNGYKQWNEKYLKLSTMFPEGISAPSGTQLELTVKIVNIKPDSDDILIPEGSELYIYSTLVDKIEYYRRQNGITNKDAFRLAYEYCMSKGLKSEIFDRWEELYMNFDKYFSLEWQWKREGYEEGVEEGIEKGIEEGKLKGKLEAAGNMRKTGISLEQISTFINIPIQELEQYEF